MAPSASRAVAFVAGEILQPMQIDAHPMRSGVLAVLSSVYCALWPRVRAAESGERPLASGPERRIVDRRLLLCR